LLREYKLKARVTLQYAAHHDTSSKKTTASTSVGPIGGAALPVW
jgi:hypothetical protein